MRAAFIVAILILGVQIPQLAFASQEPGRIGLSKLHSTMPAADTPEEAQMWNRVSRAEKIKEKGKLALEYLKKFPAGAFAPYCHGIMAMYYQENNDQDKFIQHAEKALEDLPDEVNLLVSLSMAYAEKQQPEPAIQRGTTALAVLPTIPKPEQMSAEKWEEERVGIEADANYGAGVGYLFKAFNSPGNSVLMDAATEHLEKAVALKPRNENAQFRLGFAYQLSKDLDNAILCFARAASLKGPNSSTARAYLEKAYQSKHGNTRGLDKLIAEQRKLFDK